MPSALSSPRPCLAATHNPRPLFSHASRASDARGFQVCGCLVLVLRIIQELWQASGGVFNVDDVVQDMAFGLGEELRLRTKAVNNANAVFSRDFIEDGTGG